MLTEAKHISEKLFVFLLFSLWSCCFSDNVLRTFWNSFTANLSVSTRWCLSLTFFIFLWWASRKQRHILDNKSILTVRVASLACQFCQFFKLCMFYVSLVSQKLIFTWLVRTLNDLIMSCASIISLTFFPSFSAPLCTEPALRTNQTQPFIALNILIVSGLNVLSWNLLYFLQKPTC